MTLATAILLLGIASLASVDPGVVGQTTPAQSSANAPAAQQQPSSTQTSPAGSKPSSGQSKSAAHSKGKSKSGTSQKTPQHQKDAPASAGCDPNPAAVNTGSTPGGSPQDGSTPGQASPPAEAPKNCPPPKIVVRQGGISEQSIQLAGGSPGGETTQKRQSTDQMLAATEDNLKKASSIQLSEVQQGSISQIQQFIDQSRKALQSADYERAHTLAWKAKVLSDDLVNPKK